MNASIRTLIFAGVATAFAGTAYVTHLVMQPPDLSGFDRVGQKFYPQFDDPEQAVKLRVVSYDDLKETSRPFTVEKHGDLWRIPSHHDYPAEAKKQLAETAASVIDVKREAVASRRRADHERLAVIDPLDEESTAIRGRGKRITLYDNGGKTLIDLIVGNAIEGQTDQYYVRVPTEKETYRSTLSIKLSTKFSDWIEPDLLKLSRSDLVSLEISKPIIEQRRVQTPLGQVVSEVRTGEEKVNLTRKDGFADWELDDLKEATEELDDSPIRDAVNALDDLKIVGVRPKPSGINANLTLDVPEEIAGDPARIRAFGQNLVRDLMGKGFDIYVDEKRQPYLYSREGKLTAGTDDGVVYHLHFGNRFDGSLEEIEIGTSSAGDGESTKSQAGEKEAPNKKDSELSSSEANGSDTVQAGEKKKGDQGGRYVLVRVTFDPTAIGEEPVAPVKPQKPVGSDEADKPSKKGTDEKGDADSADDAQPQSPKKPDGDEIPADKPDDNDNADKEKSQPDDGDKEKSQPEKDEGDNKKSAAQVEYEKAVVEYEEAKRKYDDEKQEFDDKVEQAGKKVKELNDRFEDWYYVISAESFEKLQLSRNTLVKVKETPDDGDTPVEAPDPSPVEAPNPSPVEAPDPSSVSGGSAADSGGADDDANNTLQPKQ
jgi:hypothetical protein